MTFLKFLSIIRKNYYATRKNKRYGADQMDFESDYASRLMKFAYVLWSKDFQIHSNYAFLTSVPKWREIFATTFEGRMADHLLCDPLVPYMEKELSDRTYNNRKGKGSCAAINQLIDDIYEVSCGYTTKARIIKLDIKGFFPSAKWDIVYQCYINLIDKYKDCIKADYGKAYIDFLKWLAMRCIYCRPAEHCTLKTPQHFWYRYIPREKSMFATEEGIPIGRLSSQHGMGLYINDEIIWLNTELMIMAVCFVDDIVMVVPENLHRYALAQIPVLREKLKAKGIFLNDKKFYDQPCQHGVEFLGTHIRPNRTHLNRFTVKRAFERIREFKTLTPKKKYEELESYVASINSYTGILKNRNDHKIVQMIQKEALAGWEDMARWNTKKSCINCKAGYGTRDKLTKKYGSQKRNFDLNLYIYGRNYYSRAA